MDATLPGIVIDRNLEQCEKASLPIDITLVGILISIKLEQYEKA